MNNHLTARELADVFGISERDVAHYVTTGLFPKATKLGYSVSACIQSFRRGYDDNKYITNAAGVAEFLGLTTQAIYKMQRQGMPRLKRGSYDLRECVRWDRERWRQRADGSLDADADEDKRKAAALRRRREELALGEVEKKLIPVEDYRADTQYLAGLIVSQLSAMPGRLAGEIATETDPGEIRQILNDWQKETRRAIADTLDKRARELNPDVISDN
jgi:phage terminase Nu1 subunit (DNA packaging protein)